MAGHPKTHAHWAKLQASRDDVIAAFARGSTHAVLAKQFGCSGRILWQWFHRADIKPLYEEAKLIRAARTVEEALEIVDTEPRLHPATGAIDPADVANRKLRADVRKWVAAKLDPSTYGDKLAVDGKVDVTHHVAGFLAGIRGDRLADSQADSLLIEGDSALLPGPADAPSAD